MSRMILSRYRLVMWSMQRRRVIRCAPSFHQFTSYLLPHLLFRIPPHPKFIKVDPAATTYYMTLYQDSMTIPPPFFFSARSFDMVLYFGQTFCIAVFLSTYYQFYYCYRASPYSLILFSIPLPPR